MNNAQRKFLLDKITEKTKARIKELRESIPEPLSPHVFMLHKVLSNDFEIVSVDKLREIILKRALEVSKKKEIREDWLGNQWGVVNKRNVSFSLEEFFVLPEDYKQQVHEYRQKVAEIEKEIRELSSHLETLEIRIMLASDKTLQGIISDVDDMGDIKLIDMKVKQGLLN